jgi:hypothetical protein
VVSILTINYGVLGAVSADANACHPNDVAYTAFTYIKLSKSMVSVFTSSKLRLPLFRSNIEWLVYLPLIME